jgi:hypothetical protein
MRNALTHRGRITNVYLPRRISGRLAVPPTSEPHKLYRITLLTYPVVVGQGTRLFPATGRTQHLNWSTRGPC